MARMTKQEFIYAYYGFCDKSPYGGRIPTDEEFGKLYDIIIDRFGDIPTDYFEGINNMAMGYVCNIDDVLGKEPETRHIHEWLHMMGMWK